MWYSGKVMAEEIKALKNVGNNENILKFIACYLPSAGKIYSVLSMVLFCAAVWMSITIFCSTAYFVLDMKSFVF